MPSLFVLRSAAAASLLCVAHSLCVMTQNCTSGPNCLPTPVSPPSQPFSLPPSPTLSCPQYNSTGGCCTAQQNLLLYVNFLAVDAAFGNCANGGCPSCLANIEALWCAVVCSPEQDQFVTPIGNKVVVDPTRGVNVTVLELAVRVNRTLADEVFASCARTRTVNETAALNTTEGFFDYQGQYEAIQHGLFVNTTFTGGGEDSLNFGAVGCSAEASMGEGEEGPTVPCPTATCNASCAYA
jgi:hypothetical protein